MNEHKQPEALRLAQDLESYPGDDETRAFAAAGELRRLHDEVEQLRKFLKEIYYQNSTQGDR